MKKIIFVIVLVIFMVSVASPVGAIYDPYMYKFTAPTPFYVSTSAGKLPVAEFYVNTPFQLSTTVVGQFTLVRIAGVTSWVYVKTVDLHYVLK